MAVNTIQELIALLNQVDTDATVLAAIANDSATATANGPGPGLVTTRLGSNVRNVQKVIFDIENNLLAGVRTSVQKDGAVIVESPDSINFIGATITITDVDGVATVTVASPTVSKVGTPANNQVAIWTGDGTVEGTSTLTYDGTFLNVRSAVTPGLNISDLNDDTVLLATIVNSGTPIATFGTTTAHELQIHTNNLPRLTVTSAGLIGIGTDTPTELLTMAAESPAIQLQDNSSGNISRILNNNKTLRIEVDIDNTVALSEIVFEIDNADVLQLFDGNLIMAANGYVSATKQINDQYGVSYTLALADTNGIVTMDNGSANTVTIDPVATTAYPLGYVVEVIQLGAGATTIDAGTGVTLNGVSAGNGTLTAQYDVVRLRHVAPDVWIVSGDIGAIA